MMKRTYHLKCEDMPECVLLCGRRKRAREIIRRVDGKVIQDEDYLLGTGRFNGRGVAICSHGIGGPSVAIVVRELAFLGGRRFIRVGTAGALHRRVQIGDVVIPVAAVRDDGSEHLAPIEFPAIASPSLLGALIERAGRTIPEDRLHIGIVHSKYDFYSEIPRLTLDEKKTRKMWENLRNLGVLCSEMECGVLFTCCALLSSQMKKGIECASILVPVGRVEEEPYASDPILQKKSETAMKTAIDVALHALTGTRSGT